MHVLFIHRKGIFSGKGGEQDQITYTRRALADLGIETDLAETLPDSLARFELVHFFGLDRSHIPEIQAAKGMPKVLSTIFWDRSQGYLIDHEIEEWPRPGRELIDRIAYFWSKAVRRRRDRRIARFARDHFYNALRAYGEFQQVINEIDLFLPNTRAEMDAVGSFYVLDRCNYRVIPNAVDLDAADNPSEFADRALPKGTPMVCCSGGIDMRKNQYSLTKAMLDVDVPLVFAGAARDARYLEAVKRVAARRKGVFFLGHLDAPDLHSVYRAASVHALPSIHDTPGISNLEAVAHECVNVGTQIGGLREYLGEHSLYCSPFSVSHIREQVLAALACPPNVEGARLVRARYTYDEVGKTTRQAYLDLLEGRL